jgi:hypothetical protein
MQSISKNIAIISTRQTIFHWHHSAAAQANAPSDGYEFADS